MNYKAVVCVACGCLMKMVRARGCIYSVIIVKKESKMKSDEQVKDNDESSGDFSFFICHIIKMMSCDHNVSVCKFIHSLYLTLRLQFMN